jgi:two-component system nitrogen regulation sensor histidine kinase NtrY
VPAGSEDAISDVTEVDRPGGPTERSDALAGWAIASGVALVALAGWLRDARVEYLVVGWFATLAAAALVPRAAGHRARVWRAIATGLAVAGSLAATIEHSELARVRSDWPAYDASHREAAAERMDRELEAVRAELVATARKAVSAPRDRQAAFARLGGLTGGAGERSVELYECDEPLAWAGTVRIATDTLTSPLGVSVTPTYTTLFATVKAGTRRAVATVLIHAEPPGSTLSRPLDDVVAAASGIEGFVVSPDSGNAGGAGDRGGHATARLALDGGGPPLVLVPRSASPAETVLRLIERGRLREVILLGLALAAFVGAVWRSRRPLRWRFGSLAVPLACVGIVPLNSLSNVTRLFDPALYFAPLGGPWTASAGALALTGSILLLGLLVLLRSPFASPSRSAAWGAVLVIAGSAPYLLRELARGMQPPAEGVGAGLWLSWETSLFVAGCALLLAGASAGRAALGGRRGLPPWVAPAIAVAAAITAPMFWEAPGRWPGWYAGVWVVAVAALAFTRRTTRLVVTAAVVASLGTSTLVWGVTARKRVELAVHDVDALREADEYALALLNRFGHELVDEPIPHNRADLLSRYVASDLAAARFPVELATWDAAGSRQASLATGGLEPAPAATADVVAEARSSGAPVLRPTLGTLGVSLVLAVPNRDSTVTSALVLPRTRLVPDDPFAPLIGGALGERGDPPYTLSLTGADSAAVADAGQQVWKRAGNELHGDWLLQTSRGLARAHAEVELRPVSSLVQRGLLIVLANLALVALLWALSALADGGYLRWVQVRRRRWSRSYRSRLTLVLFAFFVLPAIAFAWWSYRQLQVDDRQSQDLLLRETLRTVAGSTEGADVSGPNDRTPGPLLRYDRGELVASSDTLYEALAPFGRFLPPSIFLSLGVSEEVTATAAVPVGDVSAVIGYRSMTDDRGQRVVLAAPAAVSEELLDRRRRDLGVLVFFLTAIGGLAALGLSGVAAREFARPIGELRNAALSIAAGEREPILAARPPIEFRPVYSAFRRMATDLGESREALVEARRRTEAVLRTVASGVIAVDSTGTITLANPRAETLFGRPLTGTPIDALGGDALGARVRHFLASDEDGVTFEMEQGRHQLRGSLTRLSRGGGAVLTLDDITDLARAQRVLAWGEMARQVAHEIKNPLTPIRLGVQHLRRAFGAGRADFPQILDQNATRILAEIDRLDEIARSFSRYGTAPADQPLPEPTDVAPIVRHVAELEALGEDGAIFTVEGADRPVLAMARAGELRDVLVNIAENARLAGAKSVQLSIEAAADVRIVVRDDGEGIAPAVISRVFEPHFSTRTSGSGLGLAISRRLIDGWGGAITLESEPGRGTTVTIVLRRAP